MSTRISKVISGGETGVERAALYVAEVSGMTYGGYTAKDGLTEDCLEAPGVLAKYPELLEAATLDTATRTRLRVEHSDATLIILPPESFSYEATVAEPFAKEIGRPYLVTEGSSLQEVIDWLSTLAHGSVLNVVGPSEIASPIAYSITYHLLQDAFEMTG